MHDLVNFEDELNNAQKGCGTTLMDLETTWLFLKYVSSQGWAFQSMEAFEIDHGREIPDLRFAILGLTEEEQNARSTMDLENIAKSALNAAKRTGKIYYFHVWIDRPYNILRRNGKDRTLPNDKSV